MKANLNKLKFCIKRTFYIILGLFVTYCILWTCNDHLKPFFDYRNDEYTEIIENTEYSEKMKEEAESGILKAQYNLAMAYLEGNGVEKNDSLAFMWFNRYASKSVYDGYYLLGECYAQGVGVSKDLNQAFKLWIKAAVLDHQTAIKTLKEKFNVQLKREKDTFYIYQNQSPIGMINLVNPKVIIYSELISFEDIFPENVQSNLLYSLNFVLSQKGYNPVQNIKREKFTQQTYKFNNTPTNENINNDYTQEVVIESVASNLKSVIIPSNNLNYKKDFTQKALCNGFNYEDNSQNILIRNRENIQEKIIIQNDTILCTGFNCDKTLSSNK